MRLIVGLGNPGLRYERTRHNIGFRLIDSLAGPQACWKDFQGLGILAARQDLILAKPSTYMNESGRCVAAMARYYKMGHEHILICFDDVALPLGRLRLRPSGSSGGQKGMQSVIDSLGTESVPRLRIGVGPQPLGRDSTDFVLSRFSKDEEADLPAVIERGALAVQAWAAEGLEAAMNRFNVQA
ncbi:MAG: aminoacyl-tRNA hydrolase [Elusimicrobia bacterium]|nr:aminoacyl-tRNA hydrolase [Elusimicrobiota bacterium]